MEYAVRMTARAARDLENIYEFIRAETTEVAADWFDRLSEAIYSLATFPERGAAIAKSKSLRQIVFGEKPNTYKIVYTVEKKKRAVNVLHIRHGARRPFQPSNVL